MRVSAFVHRCASSGAIAIDPTACEITGSIVAERQDLRFHRAYYWAQLYPGLQSILRRALRCAIRLV